jgi:ATP-binding cassette, subfamily B, bacterial PglK
MKTLHTVWRLLDQRQQRRLVALQMLSVLMALSTVGGLAPILPFFSALAEPHAIAHYPALRFLYEHLHFSDEHRFVIALGVAFAAGVVLSNGINLLGSLAIDRFAYQVGDALHTALFNEYLHRSYGFHAKTHSSKLTNNILHETGRVTGGILRHGLILVTNIVTIVFIVGSMIFLNPRVATLAIVGLGASYAAVYALARRRLRRNGRIESREYAERTKIVSESLGAIKELIILQAQRSFVVRFARSCQSISATVVSTLAISQSPRPILECATVCVLVTVALYTSNSGEGVGPWIAQLSFMGLAVYRLLPALQQAFLAIVRIRADRHALESVADDLQRARARGPVAGSTAAEHAWRGRPRREIQLRGVSFFPAEGRPAAIANLTLCIPAGAVVGFIGANGSGKTTLVDLLSGLLVPQSGQVVVDGIVLSEANRNAWQSTLAYVPQNIFICDCTVAENIALGVPAAQIDHERVRAAVQLARLEDCVNALPNQYDEALGERGARLSGGQRQRLGIARALYREASVLIMDEPTSALDGAAEREIMDMLAARREGKTVFLIAHRLGSLQHCDVIHELAKGQIVRSGTYNELSVAWSADRAALQAYAVSGVNAS